MFVQERENAIRQMIALVLTKIGQDRSAMFQSVMELPTRLQSFVAAMDTAMPQTLVSVKVDGLVLTVKPK